MVSGICGQNGEVSLEKIFFLFKIVFLFKYFHLFLRAEIERNRNAVIEINHFLDKQREELEKITASPLGLLLLPKEVQDVLQI